MILDAARDDEGRGDAEPLSGEVDRLGWLGALELVNLQYMSIDAATQEVLMGIDRKANVFGAAYLSEVMDEPLRASQSLVMPSAV